MAKLNEMVKEFRVSINQSVEALAMMLQLRIDEYEALEADWTPPDDVLQHMCALFEWNYNDIKQIAQNHSPASVKPQYPLNETTSPSRPSSSFHGLLKTAREQAGQSLEGMATLLNISRDYYETFEKDQLPPEDLVRQICTLFGWNYRTIRQQLINHSVPRIGVPPPPLSLKEVQALPKKEALGLPPDASETETLATRLQEARTHLDQTTHGISLLLNISEDYYLKLEAGHIPEPELLKRIAALFHWNYNDLRLLVQNENIHQFQPSVTEIKTTSSFSSNQLEQLLNDIKQTWQQIQPGKQEMLLAQLEVIRDTAKRWQSS